MYENLNIAVIGDVMLDNWREGHNYKLNPESPTIDITNPSSEYTLGGAGNVARIVRSLGAKCQLLSVYGEFTPYANSHILDLCDKADIGFYAAYEARSTTVKERIVCDGQQICRISEEYAHFISIESVGKLLSDLGGMDDIDCIIVADYSKGVMRDSMVHGIYHLAQEKGKARGQASGIPTLVDPKNRLYIYKGCTIMKPNQKEYDRLAGGDSMESTREKLECEAFVITSEHGMHFTTEIETGFVPANTVEVANVSGCGDAAAAVMALEYVRSGGNIEQAVKLANWAASRVVQRERTGYLDIEDLEEFINERGETTESDISGQRRSDQQTVNQPS